MDTLSPPQTAAKLTAWHALGPSARRIFNVTSLYKLLMPVVNLLVNGFLWRETRDASLLLAFNGLYFAMIASGYYLNGLAARRVPVHVLFGAGLISLVFAPLYLVFARQFGLVTILITAVLMGLGKGLYSANYNYLTINCIEDARRNYFVSLTGAVDVVAKIVLPPAAGWWVLYGAKFYGETPVWGYRWLVAILLALSGVGAWVARGLAYPQPRAGKPSPVREVTPTWRLIRAILMTSEVNGGFSLFIPLLLALMLLNDESQAGIVTSVGAGVTLITLFVWGRYGKIRHRKGLVAAGSTIIFASSLALFTGGIGGVLLYQIFSTIGWAMDNLALEPLFAQAVVDEAPQSRTNYNYPFDMEIFTELGRVTGIAACFLFYKIAPHMAIPVAVLLSGGLQFYKIVLVRRFAKLDEEKKRAGERVGEE